MSLYDTLGVAPNATAGQIRAAYKALAQKHHPDKGHDPAMMSDINRAFETLGDPERRHEYDISGRTGRPTTHREKALAALGGALNHVVEEMEEFVDLQDPVQAVRVHLHRVLEQGAALQQTLTKKIQARQKVLRRLRFAGRDVDVLATLVGSQVQALEATMAKNEETIQTARTALDLLVDYDYEVEASPPRTAADSSLQSLMQELKDAVTAAEAKAAASPAGIRWPKFVSKKA